MATHSQTKRFTLRLCSIRDYETAMSSRAASMTIAYVGLGDARKRKMKSHEDFLRVARDKFLSAMAESVDWRS